MLCFELNDVPPELPPKKSVTGMGRYLISSINIGSILGHDCVSEDGFIDVHTVETYKKCVSEILIIFSIVLPIGMV